MPIISLRLGKELNDLLAEDLKELEELDSEE